MADQKGQPVKLVITSCTVGYEGKNKREEDYTIYEVQATRDGVAITDKKLRSFEDLPVGPEPQDLMVVPFKSEKHGVSFTLSRRGKGGSGKTQQINELQAQVKDLTGRLERVESWIRQRAAGTQGAPPRPTVDEAVAGMSNLDQRFGAEAPY